MIGHVRDEYRRVSLTICQMVDGSRTSPDQLWKICCGVWKCCVEFGSSFALIIFPGCIYYELESCTFSKKPARIMIHAAVIPILVLFLAFGEIHAFTLSPGIYDEENHFCEHVIDGRKLNFLNKEWSISTGTSTISFNICGTKNEIKQDRKTINLGSEFKPANAKDNVLKTINGDHCYETHNYTISIQLECSDLARSQPQFEENKNKCEFIVKMLKPTCQPKCTYLVDDKYLLDLRNLSYTIEDKESHQIFSVNLCGANTHCGDPEVNVCEITNTTKTNIGLTESQSISYDTGTNKFLIEGHYNLPSQKITKKYEVQLLCNWEQKTPLLKYIKPSMQGKMYKFTLESALGCIKLPHKCHISSAENIQYNLSGLYKPESWTMKIPSGSINLNICGPLLKSKGICFDQHSQVCHFGNGKFSNMGSIMEPLKIIPDVKGDSIKALFTSGSNCRNNQTYKTEIEFICSSVEQGPIFKNFTSCTYSIIWRTPHACPYNYFTSRSDHCRISDRFGDIDLNHLHSDVDLVYTSPDKSRLFYNFCGPLHFSCNGKANATFCMKSKQNQETIIGFDNKDILSDHARLRMEFVGEDCSKSSKWKVTVAFVCNYEEISPPPLIERSECFFNISFYTPHACLSSNNFYQSCVYNLDNTTYDLSSFALKDKNYVIKNGNMEYSLNVCGPLIRGPDALCRRNSMICRKDTTEPNAKFRFVSLGEIAKPEIRNGSLVIAAEMGTLCDNAYHKSFITFECADLESGPFLAEKKVCSHYFTWKTPAACPIKTSCLFHNSTTNKTMDIASFRMKALKVHIHNEDILLHLCEDQLTVQRNGVASKVLRLTRSLEYNNEEFFLKFLINGAYITEENTEITSFAFEILCNSSAVFNYFETGSLKDSVLFVKLYTNTVCKPEKLIVTDRYEYSLHEEPIPITTSQLSTNNCTITNSWTGYTFNLTDIKPDNILEGENVYIFNFAQQSQLCSGLLCKNNIALIPDINKCPNISYDFQNNFVALNYSGQKCLKNLPYKTEIQLKCGSTKESPRIKQEQRCYLIVEMNLKQACNMLERHESFLYNPKRSSHTTVIIICSLISIILILTIIFLVRKYKNRVPYLNLSLSKETTQIYMRDTRS